METQRECVVVDVWMSVGKVCIVNFYNPCNQLSMEGLHVMGRMVTAKKFGAGILTHIMLYGEGTITDRNGFK